MGDKPKVKRIAKAAPASQRIPQRRVKMAQWAPDELALKRVFGDSYRSRS